MRRRSGDRGEPAGLAAREERRVSRNAVVIDAPPEQSSRWTSSPVAANLLADRGWSVVVLEASNVPGGAVRSEELVEAGFVNDVFSAFYPLAVASPVMRRL